MATKKSTLQILAKAKKLSLDKDYYSLSASEKTILSDIMAAANYAQPAAQKKAGRSKAYSFYLYLSK